MNSCTSSYFTPHHHLALITQRTSLSCQPHDLATHFHPRGYTILLRPCIRSLSIFGGTGISTSCPSPTAFALGLGPDLPWEDCPSPGNLRLSTAEVLALISLLMPAFSLVFRPPLLTVWLQPTTHCSSTDRITPIPKLRCYVLAPDIFGAYPLDQ